MASYIRRGRRLPSLTAIITLVGLSFVQAAPEPSLAEVLKEYDAASTEQRAVISSNLVSIERGLGWGKHSLASAANEQEGSRPSS